MKRMSKIYEQCKHTEDRSIGAKMQTMQKQYTQQRLVVDTRKHNIVVIRNPKNENSKKSSSTSGGSAARSCKSSAETINPQAAMNAAGDIHVIGARPLNHSGPREKASAANSSPTGDSSGDQSASWLKKWQLQRLKGASLLQELRSKNVNLPGLSGISSGTEIGRGGAYEKSELVSAYLSARSAARAFELASMSDLEIAKAYRQHPYHQRRAPRETSVPIDLPYKRDEVLRLLLADAHDDEEDSEDCDVTATSRQNYENPNMNNFQSM